MDYVGLDVHQNHIQVQHMTEDGALGLSTRIRTSADDLLLMLSKLPASLSVSLEAGRNHWWISQLLEHHEKVSRIQVVDPWRNRNIAKELSIQKGYGRAKNDRIDAEMLGEANRLQLSPWIHLPTPDQLEKRSLSRHRLMLVQSTNSLSARVQALVSMHGLTSSTAALLKDLELSTVAHLPAYVSFLMKQLLDQIRFLQEQIHFCECELDKVLPKTEETIRLLLTVPGIGIVTARIIVTEILSISYFQSPKYLISYSGLAPIEHDSDGSKGIIKLNRHCNYFLKYAFLTAAHGARRHVNYYRKYDRDVKKYDKIRAKINLGRKIIKAVYWMLTRQQPFKEVRS